MMGKNIKRLLLGLTLAQASFGQVTIHVLNPWASDPSLAQKPLYIYYNQSWYPGIKMIGECNNWYTLTLPTITPTLNDHFQFAVYPVQEGQNAVKYPPTAASN